MTTKPSFVVVPMSQEQVQDIRNNLDTDYTLRLQAIDKYVSLFYQMLNKELDYFLNHEYFMKHIHPNQMASEKEYLRQKYKGLDMLVVWIRLDHVQKALWLGQLDPLHAFPGFGGIDVLYARLLSRGMERVFFMTMTSLTNALKEATLVAHFLHWLRDWPLGLSGEIDTWHHLTTFEKRLLMHGYSEFTWTRIEPTETKAEDHVIATRPRWPIPSDAGLTLSQSRFIEQTDRTNAWIVKILVYS